MVVKMNKIVGKIVLSTIVLMTVVAQAKIDMRITTVNGERCQSVAVGQPFIIEVTIDNVSGSVAAPLIDGLEKYDARRTGVYMSSINGVSSTKYSYQVRINQLGTYTIGPARIHHNGVEMISDAVTVHVQAESGPVAAAHTKKVAQQTSNAFLRLLIDKESVVVGEKVTATLRFFYQDPSATLSHIGQPEVPHFDMKQISAPHADITTINGQEYRYAEWQWDMYPAAAGEFIIPAYSADYEIPTKNSHAFGFFMLFNQPAERKRVYSNAVKIVVRPLPHYDGEVHGIGNFTRMDAAIKPSIAKEGEGMIFSLEIEGEEGNWDQMKTPVLTMPQELRYYESRTLFTPADGTNLAKKKFEFIVQGLKTGDCEIPEQRFTFFNTHKQLYKTIKSAPLIVSIMPNPLSSHSEVPHTKTAVFVQRNDVIKPLNEHGPWYIVPERKPLPWLYFYLLALLPLLYSIYPFIRTKIVAYSTDNARIRKRRAFKSARKMLKECSARNDVAKLYYIFIHLFSECSQQPAAAVSRELIVLSLQKNNVSQAMLDDWNSFFENSANVAFGVFNKHINTYDLWRMAEQWIDRLEKIL